MGAADRGARAEAGVSARPHVALDATPRTGAGKWRRPLTCLRHERYSEHEPARRSPSTEPTASRASHAASVERARSRCIAYSADDAPTGDEGDGPTDGEPKEEEALGEGSASLAASQLRADRTAILGLMSEVLADELGELQVRRDRG